MRPRSWTLSVLAASCVLGGANVPAGLAQTKAGSVGWSDDFGPGWMEHWQVRRKGSWGLVNAQVLPDPTGRFERVLRVTYPQNSASPTAAKQDGCRLGGVQFEAGLGMSPTHALHLRYYVRFGENFDFVKGGKLPGLFGGSMRAGGQIPDGTNGFSTRFMWRRQGQGEVYAYLPTSVQHGTSLGRGSWRFVPGTWHLVEQEVRLNTPGQKDGIVRVWIDGQGVLENTTLVFRSVDSVRIEGILFSTFFGGNDGSWATPKTTHADFAAVAVGAQYLGPVAAKR
jgi:hypothetical protein